jgi:uncharacterized membrane protein (DUF2068 family)
MLLSRMEPERGRGTLLAIAIFKLVKAAALIAIGVTMLSLARDSGTLTSLERIANHLRLGPDNQLIDRAISAISGLNTRKLEGLGLGTFVYAAIFLTEGTGLVLRKHWAEYLTTIVTASFIPFEVYELTQRVSVFRLAGLLVNIAIVVYLLLRILARRR